MGKLVLYMPDGSTREVSLSKERVTIGRRADNDLALPFPAVSATHAAIVTVLSDSFLEDLGSTNGTFVNGKSVTKHFLRDRDRLDIGRENLIYYVDDSALPDPLPAELLHHDHFSVAKPFETYRPDEMDAAIRDVSRSARGSRRDPRQVATEFDPPPEVVDPVERTTRFRAVVSNPAEDGSSTTDEPAVAQAIDTQDDDAPSLAIKVMTGPGAGREVPLAKAETSLGRVGVSVAMLKRVGDDVWLMPVEGTETPLHNGAPIPAQGAAVSPGDKIEVAGTELTLIRR